MFTRFTRLSAAAVAALTLIVIAAPAASASSEKPALEAVSSAGAGDVKTTAWPISPPRAFPPGTPCYREEVVESIYETSQGTKMYDFFFGANVCIFNDQILVYDPESEVYYPNGVQDPRLASVAFAVRNRIAPVDPNDVLTYSALTVYFCPDLPQPSGCQVYDHQLGLEFTRGWVYPIGRFLRIA
ncbi:hypothetical protein [Lentzea sp. NBRC 102530]|uniref:hypothetical protein n=1 Tax=Lentzea sp. NBRC 102530 TaxID=3032201 RepID=UPI0024A51003|nr:hypothetical protein [Lentzea sp. NBRC 102530]GLY47710.1 hypothetical protein Lesp01_13660 [Lentzea sp. NBRC 102530]